MQVLVFGLALMSGLTFVTVKAIAGENASTQVRLHDAITQCRSLTATVERLDCYDAIVLGESSTPGPTLTTDVSAQESQRDGGSPEGTDFGFEYDVKDATQSMISDVNQVRKNAKGGLVLTLGNGQVWQQSDGQTLFLDEGDSVTITRGALSAFYLSKDGKGRRYKFARVQ